MLPLHIDQATTALLVLLAFLAYLYVYVPFKTKVKQVKPVQVEYQPIEIGELPVELSEAFLQAAPQLASMGFVSIGAAQQDIPNNKQTGCVSIWVKQSDMDIATIVGVSTYSPQVGLNVQTLVSFRTEFTDGTSIVTANSKYRPVFPPDPLCNSVRCPGVSDFHLLYWFHRARVEQDRGSRTATLHRAQNPIARLELEHTETYTRLIDAGYYELDSVRQRYVPTLKGAFFMTYRLLPPFKQIAHFNRLRTTNRTLKRLGFGDLRRFELSQSLS